MRRVHAGLAITLAGLLALVLGVGPAHASPPVLQSVGHDDRHPTATFAPLLWVDYAAIYLATSPARASDGSFLTENIAELDFLTDREIEAGSWFYEHQLDPGTYYAMLGVPVIDCVQEPCPSGFSDVAGPLTIPKPRQAYRATIEPGFVGSFELRVSALDGVQPYKLCWNRKNRRRKCERSEITGFDWSSSASDTIHLTVRDLRIIRSQRRVRFTWHVGGRRVASRTVRRGALTAL